jgi:hypothetical protein
MTPSIVRVRMRVAGPVASQVEATRPFSRATTLTQAVAPLEGLPVKRAVKPERMLSIVAGGTAYVWYG